MLIGEDNDSWLNIKEYLFGYVFCQKYFETRILIAHPPKTRHYDFAHCGLAKLQAMASYNQITNLYQSRRLSNVGTHVISKLIDFIAHYVGHYVPNYGFAVVVCD